VKDVSKVIVAGLGEVGKPLFELLSEEHEVIGVDVGPPGERRACCRPAHVLPVLDQRLRWRIGPAISSSSNPR